MRWPAVTVLIAVVLSGCTQVAQEPRPYELSGPSVLSFGLDLEGATRVTDRMGHVTLRIDRAAGTGALEAVSDPAGAGATLTAPRLNVLTVGQDRIPLPEALRVTDYPVVRMLRSADAVLEGDATVVGGFGLAGAGPDEPVDARVLVLHVPRLMTAPNGAWIDYDTAPVDAAGQLHVFVWNSTVGSDLYTDWSRENTFSLVRQETQHTYAVKWPYGHSQVEIGLIGWWDQPAVDSEELGLLVWPTDGHAVAVADLDVQWPEVTTWRGYALMRQTTGHWFQLDGTPGMSYFINVQPSDGEALFHLGVSEPVRSPA